MKSFNHSFEHFRIIELMNTEKSNLSEQSVVGAPNYGIISTSNKQNTNTRQQNINNNFCGIKNGVISGGAKKGSTWPSYVKEFNVTPQEVDMAKNSCPNSEAARQQNIDNAFCSVKQGIIPSGKNAGKTWSAFVKEFNVTQKEIQIAKNSCPSSELAKKTTRPAVDYRQTFAKSAAELGIQNGNMDTKTLQAILDQLNSTGLQAPQSVSSLSVNPDDPNSLMAILNQLNNLS